MRPNLILVAGVVMFLSSLAHGLLGWPVMSHALHDAGADEDLVGALAAGWYFGSASMAAFGAIVVSAGRRMRRGDSSGRAAVLIVAACYVVFGLAASLSRGLNPHFLLFVFTGLLAGLPAAHLPRPR